MTSGKRTLFRVFVVLVVNWLSWTVWFYTLILVTIIDTIFYYSLAFLLDPFNDMLQPSLIHILYPRMLVKWHFLFLTLSLSSLVVLSSLLNIYLWSLFSFLFSLLGLTTSNNSERGQTTWVTSFRYICQI